MLIRMTGASSIAAAIIAAAAGTTTPAAAEQPVQSAVDAQPVKLTLNESFIAQTWLNESVQRPETQTPYNAHVRAETLREKMIDVSDIEYDNPRSLVAGVMRSLPSTVRIWPTERYYYYKFPLRERMVSGNLRFVDIEAGVLHAGYFDDFHQVDVRTLSLVNEKDEGFDVRRVEEDIFDVTLDGVTVRFEIVTSTLSMPESLRLAEGEEFITGVLDESAIHLSLLWHDPTEALYFLLNEDRGRIEELIPFGPEGLRLYVGADSRFVYHHDEDYDRKLLVGVYQQYVQRNNYFDGPFDQVPPRLDIRDKLHRSYPYTRLGAGIDRHGVFVDNPGSRVAISPYLTYNTLQEVITHAQQCVESGDHGPELWARMTYESKRDFHESLLATWAGTIGDVLGLQHGDGAHGMHVSQGWSSNHQGDVSRGWPATHHVDLSKSWPKNHRGSLSAARSVVHDETPTLQEPTDQD